MSTRRRNHPGQLWKVSANTCLDSVTNLNLPRPDIKSLKVARVRTPLTVTAALGSPEADHWYDAMKVEYQQMLDFNTWTLETLPPNRRVISCKWVFDVKPSLMGDGSVRKFKARLVVKGFSQRHGIDYSETFAPVAHSESFRIVMSLAAQNQLFLRQVDIVGAFLIGEMTEDIYMKHLMDLWSKAKPILSANFKRLCTA